MATAAKKTPSKKPGTSLTLWEQQMAASAAKQAKAEKLSNGFKQISIRGGILSVDQNPVKGNELRCVILVGVPENQYYVGKFDPDTPQSPLCYAFGDAEADDPEEGMAPHEAVKEPQSKTCKDCEHNEWGTADTGRGKACKNVRRVALITEDAISSPEALEEAEVRMLKVPVMSVRNYSKLVHTLADDVQRPTWGVVTKIYPVPDPKSQFKLQFEFEELIQFNQKLYDAMQKRLAEVKKEIIAPYPDMSDIEKPQRGKAQPMQPKGRVAQKAVAGKRKY